MRDLFSRLGHWLRVRLDFFYTPPLRFLPPPPRHFNCRCEDASPRSSKPGDEGDW